MNTITGTKALYLELFKLKRKKTFLLLFSMTLIQGLWLVWAMRNADIEQLSSGYTSCLYQFPMLNAIILPVLLGILSSQLCDVEHKGNTLKQLLTMQRGSQLFNAKLLCAILSILLTTFLQIIILYAMGKFYRFKDPFSYSDALTYFITQSLCSLFILLLIQSFALIFINQFVPLVIGLICGLLGLMSMFFPPWVMRIVPSSYYGLLSTVGMNWDADTRVITYFKTPFPLFDCLLLMAAIILLYFIGKFLFIRKEV